MCFSLTCIGMHIYILNAQVPTFEIGAYELRHALIAVQMCKCIYTYGYAHRDTWIGYCFKELVKLYNTLLLCSKSSFESYSYY